MQELNPQDMCQVRTAGYRPPMGYRPLFTQMSLPPFTLTTVEWMKRDSQVRLCMAIKKAPYHKVLVRLKGDPEVTQFMGDQIRRFWTKALPKVTNAFWYTQCAGETVYKFNARTNRYEFSDLLDFYPADVNYLHVNNIPIGISVRSTLTPADGLNNGASYMGSGPTTKLLFPKGFLYIHNREFRSMQGHSEFESAYEPWLEKTDYQGGRACRKLWFYKNVFNGGILFHPPGDYQTPDGKKIAFSDIARNALENAVNGAVWTFAQKFDTQGNPMWSYKPAAFNPGGEGLINYIQVLDIEIAHGMGIPDDVLQSVSESGSRAGRSVPLMAFFLSQQETLVKMFQVIDEQIFRPLCKANFGHDDYEASVEIDIDRLLGVVQNGGQDFSPPEEEQGFGDEDQNPQQMSEGVEDTDPASTPLIRQMEHPSIRVINYTRHTRRRPIRMSFDPNQPRDDDGKWTSKGGQKIGSGNNGDVYRVGNRAYKPVNKNEAEAYASVSGVRGIAQAEIDDNAISTPFYSKVVSVDAIPPEKRKSAGAILKNGISDLVNGMTALSNRGFEYNDQLQVGVDDKRNANIFDLSMAQKTSPEDALIENMSTLSNFLIQFGLERDGQSISRAVQVMQYVNDPSLREFDSESEIAKNAEKIAANLGGPAKFAYYSFNARTIPKVAQTDFDGTNTVVFSSTALPPEFLKIWELKPAIAEDEKPVSKKTPIQMSAPRRTTKKASAKKRK